MSTISASSRRFGGVPVSKKCWLDQGGSDSCGQRGELGRVHVAGGDRRPQDRLDDLESGAHHGVGEDGTHFGFVQELVDGAQAGKGGLAGQDVAVGSEHGQQVLSDRSSGARLGERRQSENQSGVHQIVLAGPAPVQRGLAGMGARRDALHGQPAVSDRGQLGQRGLVERMFEYLAAPTAPAAIRGGFGGRRHSSIVAVSVPICGDLAERLSSRRPGTVHKWLRPRGCCSYTRILTTRASPTAPPSRTTPPAGRRSASSPARSARKARSSAIDGLELAVDRADQLGGYRIGELTAALRALGVDAPIYLGGAGRWRDSGMADAETRRRSAVRRRRRT